MGFSRHSLSRWRATQLSPSNKTVAFVNVIKVDVSDSQYDHVWHAPLNQFFFMARYSCFSSPKLFPKLRPSSRFVSAFVFERHFQVF